MTGDAPALAACPAALGGGLATSTCTPSLPSHGCACTRECTHTHTHTLMLPTPPWKPKRCRRKTVLMMSPGGNVAIASEPQDSPTPLVSL